MKHDLKLNRLFVILICFSIMIPILSSNSKIYTRQNFLEKNGIENEITQTPKPKILGLGISQDENFGIEALIPPPALYDPPSGTHTNDNTPYLDWYNSPGATEYQIQVDNSGSFTSPEEDTITMADGYQCGTLSDGVYYWRVRARDSLSMWTAWSSVWNFRIDTVPPSAPSLYSPSNGGTITDNTPTLDWGSASGAVLYRLVVDDSASFSSPAINIQTSSTVYVVPTPLPDRPWYWRVQARDQAGNWGSYTTTWSFTIDTTPPVPPTLYSPSNHALLTTKQNGLDWSDVPTAVQYNLHLSQSASFSSTLDYYVGGSYFLTPSLGEGKWYWRVRARDAVNNWGSWSSVWDYTIDSVPPGVPGIVSPIDDSIVSDSTPYLDWSSVTDATIYQIQLDNNADFSSTIINTQTSNTYLTSSVLSEGEYHWRVRARDAAGNWGSWSTTSSFVVDTTIPVIADVIYVPDSVDDNDEMQVVCNITDLNGIGNAILYYRVNTGSWNNVAMTWVVDNHYVATLGVFNYDDFVEFYIVANDTATNPNTATNDNGGSYYSFTIVSSDLTGPTITGVTHEPSPPNDAETVTISCTITDENGVASVVLYYRINDGSWTPLSMDLDTGDIYEAVIGSFDYDDFIEYYVVATDSSPNSNSETNDNGGFYYSFTVVSSDVTGPTIENIQNDPLNPDDDDIITIYCDATDLNNVQSVTLYYRVNGGSWTNVLMYLDTGDTYYLDIGPFNYDDLIEYYIEAVDNSPNHNSAVEDNGGLYYSFTISSSDLTVPFISSIEHHPTIPNDIETITVSCTVTDANGIQSVVLYYRINGGSWLNIAMTNTIGDVYSVTIGPFDYANQIDYYVVATDNSPNHNEAIDDNSGSYYSFTIISNDTTPPTIENIQLNPVNPTDNNNVIISCDITDNNGIFEVTLYYRINGGSWISSVMNLVSGDTYSSNIGVFDYADFIEYQIVATDNSPNYNTIVDDNSGSYYNFTIASSDVLGPTIQDVENDPETPTDLDVITIHCEVNDTNGVAFVTLHYRINGGSWFIVNMTNIADSIYELSIGSHSYDDLIEYYITSVDASPNENEATNDNGGTYYQFTILSGDVTAPTISDINHTPENPTSDDLVNVTCSVIDTNGIQVVRLFYRINGGVWLDIFMVLDTGNTYSATIEFLNAGDNVQYYIVAIDDSPNNNTVTDDNSGSYYSFMVGIPTTNGTNLMLLIPLLVSIPLFVVYRKRR